MAQILVAPNRNCEGSLGADSQGAATGFQSGPKPLTTKLR